MKFAVLHAISPAKDRYAVCAVWSPNGYRLAAAMSDNTVHLFDAVGNRRDKFAAKSANSTNFIICALAFSPDSSRLALAQNDGSLFVYRLGASWDDKKVICNKFVPSNAAITCLTWTSDETIFFGTADSKIYRAELLSNKCAVVADGQGESVIHIDDRVAVRADGSLHLLLDSRKSADLGESCTLACRVKDSILAITTNYQLVSYSIKRGQIELWQSIPAVFDMIYVRNSVWIVSTEKYIPWHRRIDICLMDCSMFMWRESGKLINLDLPVPPSSITFLCAHPSNGTYCLCLITGEILWIKEVARHVVLSGGMEVWVFSDMVRLKSGTSEAVIPVSERVIKVSAMGGHVVCLYFYDRTVFYDIRSKRMAAVQLNLLKSQIELVDSEFVLAHNFQRSVLVGFDGKYCTVSRQIDEQCCPTVRFDRTSGQLTYLMDPQCISLYDVESGQTRSIRHKSRITEHYLLLGGRGLALLNTDGDLVLVELAADGQSTALAKNCTGIYYSMKSSLLVSESQTQLLIWNVAFFSAGPIHSIVKHGRVSIEDTQGFAIIIHLTCGHLTWRVQVPNQGDLKISSPSRRLERPSENIINRPDNLKFLLDCGDFHRAAKIDKKETVKHLMDMSMWWQASVISSGGPNLYGELTKGNFWRSLECTLNAHSSATLIARMRLLELLETFGISDSVELARLYKSLGDANRAEKLLISIGSWKQATELYQSSELFEEAYSLLMQQQVVDNSLAVDLAYQWVKIECVGTRREIAAKLELGAALVELAIYRNDFDLALELSENREDIVQRNAAWLVQQNRFEDATSVLVEHGLIKDAITLLFRLKEWEKAESFIRSRFPDALAEYAKFRAADYFENQNYAQLERTVLDYQAPDVAVSLYKNAGMWPEAIRFAKKYVPSLLKELESERDRGSSGSGSMASAIQQKGKFLEQSGKYADAVSLYMSTSLDEIGSLAEVSQFWIRAVELTSQFLPERLPECVSTVATHFQDAKQFEKAGKLFVKSGDLKKAAVAFCEGHHWNEARTVAKSDTRLQDMVDSYYIQFLRNHELDSDLAGIDQVACLDLFVQRGDWQRCLEKAKAIGYPEVLNRYLAAFIAVKLESDDFNACLDAYAQYGIPMSDVGVQQFLSVTRYIFDTNKFELVEILYRCLMKHESSTSLPTLARVLFALHLITLRERHANSAALTILSKISVSLLRYADFLRADCVFYDAGLWAKRSDKEEIAFLLWNEYLDVCDAIDEQLAHLVIDHGDFIGSDIPQQLTLPKTILSDSHREEVRSWILAKSIEGRAKVKLPTRPCTKCQALIAETSLFCQTCMTSYEPCIVTGMPVLDPFVRCANCHRMANKNDWNVFVYEFKACPWCRSAQKVIK